MKDEVFLRVTYRLRADQVAAFEEIFSSEILPLVQEHRLELLGFWKTLVGEAGEFMELWRFSSLSEFGDRWGALFEDPRLQEVFRRTGPMVSDERFTLMTAAGDSRWQKP